MNSGETREFGRQSPNCAVRDVSKTRDDDASNTHRQQSGAEEEERYAKKS
jgi:hypothetical protein